MAEPERNDRQFAARPAAMARTAFVAQQHAATHPDRSPVRFKL